MSGSATAFDAPRLDEAMRQFTAITAGLREGYATLSERAERVEHELMLANGELERKVHELDEVKRHLEAILQALPTGVVVRDEAGCITRVNNAALSALGIEASADAEAALRIAGSGEGDTRSMFELQRPGGRRRVLSSDCSPMFGPEERLMGSVQIIDDCTEMTELSERLHAMDKLAALGTMAGGIAHEIRNPLNAVQGFASLLLKQLEEGSEAHKWASRIIEGSEEANGIVRSMLSFAKPDKLCIERIRADELVSGALANLEQQDCADFPWTITSECAPLTLDGDRIKLRQALRNLVTNAINAQPSGGSVHVAVHAENSQAVIRVSDAGPGIPPDIVRRIFDPFFTTRAEGTGLGLALTQTIARLHGGEVSVSSDPSHLGGADVTFRLPLTPCNG